VRLRPTARFDFVVDSARQPCLEASFLRIREAEVGEHVAATVHDSAATWRSRKELWWIRHGETDWNLALRIQGSSDVQLNETGVSQARALARGLKDVAFVAVYASDLARAHRTASLTSSGAEVRADLRLREPSYGMLDAWEAAARPTYGA
jgi:hypothetical protein